MVPRTKRSKKHPIDRPAKTPLQIVKNSNYVCLAIVIRTLWTVYGWRNKRINAFIECYIALVQELADRRSYPEKVIKETKDLTGVDVRVLIDEIYGVTR